MLLQVLLQPHDPTVILGGNVPASNDPVPIGATVEQINRFSTTYKYIKENDIPENEQERCTVSLYFLSSICIITFVIIDPSKIISQIPLGVSE